MERLTLASCQIVPQQILGSKRRGVLRDGPGIHDVPLRKSPRLLILGL